MAARPVAVHGRAEVTYRQGPETARLDHLYQSDPLRVMFPEAPRDEIATAAIVTTSGGVVGGDVLEIAATVEDGARALIHQQAAEKIYRSAGPDARIEVALAAGPGAWLEWLPQETILFDGARLRRSMVIHRAPGASVLAGEILVFGRLAHGERLTTGLVRDAWEVRENGNLVWAEALHLDGDIDALLTDPVCFGGARAMASIVFAADDAADHLPTARALLGDSDGQVRAGATVVNGVLVVRYLGNDAFALRRNFGAYWAKFRAAAGGLPARLPRLWDI